MTFAMCCRRLLPLLVINLVAVAALAQTDAEFSRASGGVIDGITKAPSKTSGSLSLTHSTGLFGGRGYEGTLGGELVADRLWFFGAGSVLPGARLSSAKVTTQPVDWNSVTASFSQVRQPLFTTTLQPAFGSLPRSFLSLHSTAMLSNQMMLNVSLSQQH